MPSVAVDLVLPDSVGFKMLYIAFDEKKDTDLAERLQDDLTKIMAGFKLDVPISIQPGTHQATGGAVLKMDLINKEAAITAYLGLKLKYPGIEIDKKGIMCAEVWEIFLPSVFRSTGGCQGRDLNIIIICQRRFNLNISLIIIKYKSF